MKAEEPNPEYAGYLSRDMMELFIKFLLDEKDLAEVDQAKEDGEQEYRTINLVYNQDK